MKNCPLITQFAYNTVHSYGPQTKSYKGPLLSIFNEKITSSTE